MWFEPHISGLIGGIMGSSIGVLGGVLGTLAGLFIRKGKHKKLVLSLAVVMILLAGISLCLGIIALFRQQPYHVWYPFVLVGIISTGCISPNYFIIKKLYAKMELKNMTVDDL